MGACPPPTASTSYIATFELEDGSRLGFPLSGSEYGLLAEQDRGRLEHQGTRDKTFTRLIEERWPSARIRWLDGAMVQVDYLRDETMNFETVAILGEEFGGGLSIQRGLSFDAEDVELGMATYCLSRGIGATFYGGVDSWSLSGQDLDLTLTPEAARALSVPEALTFALTPSAAATVAEHLPRLLQP